jgi:small subunit ribosomal protein S6
MTPVQGKLMPQYELMYLLGANVADTDVPNVSAQVKKFVEDFGGTDIVETQLGKKKLAYTIKKTRNGHYVTVNFGMDAKKINELDARIHSMDQSIIRYIIINLDEHLQRMAKDKIAQSKIIRRIPAEAAESKSEVRVKKPAAPMVELDEKALDEKIEAALTEDLTK